MKEEDADAAEEAGIRLLARREHAGRELRGKLLQRGHDGAAIELALKRLRERGYLSDARFAEEFIRRRYEQGYGPLRVLADLQARGVDEDLYRPLIDRPECDWHAQALAQKRRRFGAGPPADRRERARQGRFLAGRGFTADQVRRAVDETGAPSRAVE